MGEIEIMRKEIKDLFGERESKLVHIKELDDLGNEQVHNVILNYNDNEDYEKQTKAFEKLSLEIFDKVEEQLNSGDHAVTLEAAFQTNNHYIFVITALK